MLAFIKLTPWRLGRGTSQAVHDHVNAESFILDRIIGVKEKAYDAVNPIKGPAIPAQTVSIIRYAGMNQIEDFEVMEPKHEIMRICAMGQEYQSGNRQIMGRSQGYVDISADWERCHIVGNIMTQFKLTDRQAVLVYDTWLTRKFAVEKGLESRRDRKPAEPMHFSEVVAKVRNETPVAARNKQSWQDKLDLLDAEMSEALNSEQSGRYRLIGRDRLDVPH